MFERNFSLHEEYERIFSWRPVMKLFPDVRRIWAALLLPPLFNVKHPSPRGDLKLEKLCLEETDVLEILSKQPPSCLIPLRNGLSHRKPVTKTRETVSNIFLSIRITFYTTSLLQILHQSLQAIKVEAIPNLSLNKGRLW